AVAFHAGGRARDENGCGRMEMRGAPRHAESVVAGRRGDDPPCAHVGWERRDRIECAAQLERPGDLRALEFEVDVALRAFAQCEWEAQWCAADDIADAVGRGEDLGWAQVGEHFGMLCVDITKREWAGSRG